MGGFGEIAGAMAAGAAAGAAGNGVGAGKPDLADIETDFQVQDDRTADWSPKLFGAIPLLGLGGTQHLTVTEGELLDQLTTDRGFNGLREFRNIKDDAFETANTRFPPPAGPIPAAVEAQIQALPADQQDIARALWPTNDGQNDAFRHAYWSAELTREFGAEWATQFTTAHEAIPGNPGIREAMDLYNNSIGIAIAEANPNASSSELADLVAEAVNDGDLVVVNQAGHLEWSDNIAIGQHGMAPSAPFPGVIGVPNGNANPTGS